MARPTSTFHDHQRDAQAATVILEVDSIPNSPTGGDQSRFIEYRQTRDRGLRDMLLGEHQWLVRYCANRFAGKGEPLEDLEQVAQLGLLKALERYDPDHGSTFPAFAIPTVFGELKRHFRDTTWAVRVPRRASDLLVTVGAAIDTLSQSLGRTPTVTDIAGYLRVTEDEVLTAMEAGAAYRFQPLAPPSDELGGEGDGLGPGVDDAGLDPARLDVRMAISELPEEDQRVIYLRFCEGLTQSEIAARIGRSQVHVSRCLRSIFRRMEARSG
jgi:RNA polymerase sigma-B factor